MRSFPALISYNSLILHNSLDPTSRGSPLSWTMRGSPLPFPITLQAGRAASSWQVLSGPDLTATREEVRGHSGRGSPIPGDRAVAILPQFPSSL